MSSKTSKTATKVSNVIVTRKKSAQIRTKTKKNAKPVNRKQIDKTESQSTIQPKTDTKYKDTPLKNKVRTLVRFVEQVEYHPDKLKRDVSIKKVFLKPKHNFKIIAATNKRKLGVPQKGGLNPPSKKHCFKSAKSQKLTKTPEGGHHSAVSIVDVVRLIEDSHNLSDEDFMEILTCPSPVWWEEPPDDRYVEDAIYSRDPEPTQTNNNLDKTEKNNKRTKPSNQKKARSNENSLLSIENNIKKFEITIKKNNNEKFNDKKQKLENVLCNIRNVKNYEGNNVQKTNETKDEEVQSKGSTPVKSRRASTSTDGGLSDLSFNEEEILKNLENLDIPVQEPKVQNITNENDKTCIKNIKQEIKTDFLPVVNSSVIPDILPLLTRKPNFKELNRIKNENPDSCSKYNLDYTSYSNFKFITDDDVVETSSLSNSDENVNNIDNNNLDERGLKIEVDSINKDDEDHELRKEQLGTNNTGQNNASLHKKVINNLSEYITVYKIVSKDSPKRHSDSVIKCLENNNDKPGNGKGKLNSFYKKCKNNKRLKKSDNSLPTDSATNSNSKSLTAINNFNMKTENSDEKRNEESDNRLKPCDYCVVKSENGTTNFSCDECEKTAAFSCDICNFHANSGEINKKHVSSCKEVARISWKHNYLINQT